MNNFGVLLRDVVTTSLLSIALVGIGTSSAMAASNKPFNRIIIGLDASGSFKGRQTEALSKAKGLLDRMAEARTKRWEKADEIFVVSVDAIPEVIWKGTAKDLRQVEQSTWMTRFRARSDYAKCTDIEALFKLAAEIFGSDPTPTKKYLWVFSDLIAEPPSDSPTKCRKAIPASHLARNLPWELFADISTMVFWVPIGQKHAWSKIVSAQGLIAAFQLYSESESADKPLDPPQIAKRQISEAEKQQTREEVVSWIGSVGTAFIYGLGLLLVLGAVVGTIGKLMNRRASNVSRPVRINRPIPPVGLRRPNNNRPPKTPNA